MHVVELLESLYHVTEWTITDYREFQLGGTNSPYIKKATRTIEHLVSYSFQLHPKATMHFSKLTLSAAASLLVSSCQATEPTAGWAQASAKNFIYIVPDGFGPASQAMARDFVSLLKNGENVKRPVTYQLAADQMVGELSVCVS